MITFWEGTVFSTDAKTKVNTVNCVGALGRGIALEFNLRYEGLESDYKLKCDTGQLRIGRPTLHEVSDKEWILNFPTKQHWRYPSKLEWIEQGLQYFAENYKLRDFQSIAFPKLGCGNGKLDWADVKEIMVKYLSNLDIDVYICLGETEYIDEISEKMIEFINTTSKDILMDVMYINSKVASCVLVNRPYSRFLDLLKINGYGKSVYMKGYRNLYKMVKNNEEIAYQVSLFDNE